MHQARLLPYVINFSLQAFLGLAIIFRMITSIKQQPDGRFRITVQPDLTGPFRGVSWGTMFDCDGKLYMAQGTDSVYAKGHELIYVVEAVPKQPFY